MPVLPSLAGANQEIDLNRKFVGLEFEPLAFLIVSDLIYHILWKWKELTHFKITRDLETTLYLGVEKMTCGWVVEVMAECSKPFNESTKEGLAAQKEWDPREAVVSASSKVQGSLRMIWHSYGEWFSERSCPWEGGILQHGCHILEPSVDDLWQEWWLYVVISWHRG